MATIALQITPTGPVAPSYADILQELKIGYWSIFGSDAALDADTQDGQLLSIFAQAVYDSNQAGLAVYNAFSPATAQGSGLSSVVKINGLQRKVATNSQVVVTVVGVVGTIIANGIVGDNQNLGTQWALPATVTIPIAGTIAVTATATDVGATLAGPGTLTRILTPTLGWQTVTNPAAAVAGSPIETDSALRQRQSQSTALPAQTILEGIFAAVANVPIVERLAVLENDTDVADANGIPPHSIAVVVEGGDVTAIAQAIAAKKSPGTGTFGTTSIVVVDDHGASNTINFFAASDVRMSMHLTIHALAGYVSTTGDALEQALVDFIKGLSIGEDSFLARLYSPANLGGVGLGSTFVVTAILQSKFPAAPAAADVAIAFNEAAVLALDDIILTVT